MDRHVLHGRTVSQASGHAAWTTVLGALIIRQVKRLTSVAKRRSPTVAVCSGKDCARDEREQWRKLVGALDGHDVVTTPCMGLCNGPVATVMPPSGTPVVLRRIRTGRRRRALLGWLQDPGAPVPGELEVVHKEKKRAKALKVTERARRAA